MKIQMVDLVGQYKTIQEDIDASIKESLETGMFIGGSKVNQFAENLSSFLKVNHTVTCGNGTDALQLALMALELSPGDEVITTPFTFVATAEVIKLLGLKAVFVDIDPLTFNIDPEAIRAAVTPRTKCIIPVHLFGQPADMNEIMDIAKTHDLFVIEDNAQAIGSDYQFQGATVKAGTIGHIGTTSFFPSKNLGAFGDGGAVFTNDEELAKKLKLFANHGSSRRYYYDSIGINSRLDALQAGILDIKLAHLETFNAKRLAAANYYDELFSSSDNIETPYRAKDRSHVFHQYTLRIKEQRDVIKAKFQEEKIPFGIYYPLALHHHVAYKESADFNCPIADKACKEVFSLPMHTELTPEMQDYIAKTILDIVK